MIPINRYHDVSAAVTYISPQRATEMLGNNSEHQRKISTSNLTKLTNEMAEGRFCLNGESIIVGKSGKVLNGQHRLLASINSRVGFWTVLVQGIDDEQFFSIDSGKKRDLRDVLFINGETNISHLATTLIRVTEYLKNPALLGTEMVVSNGEALDVLAAHPGIRESVNALSATSRLKGVISVSRCAWLHYFAVRANAEVANAFFEGLASGVMLPATSPIYVLRARLVAEKSSERRLLVRDVMALLIKGWNAHVANQQIKILRLMPNEAFPLVNLKF